MSVLSNLVGAFWKSKETNGDHYQTDFQKKIKKLNINLGYNKGQEMMVKQSHHCICQMQSSYIGRFGKLRGLSFIK
jgi:hypothetical protein